MIKWIVLIFGLLLLVLGACGWYELSLRIQTSDAMLAFQPLAEIPSSQLSGEVSVEVSAPQGSQWDRIKRSWGEPEYEVAVVSARVAHGYKHCLDVITVRADAGGKPLKSEAGDWLYGYSTAPDSSHCNTYGVRFRIPERTMVDMHFVAVAGPLPIDTKVVVVPVWFYTKDKLVGLSIDQDLRNISKWTMVLGLFAIPFAAFLFIRSKRKAPAQVEAAS